MTKFDHLKSGGPKLNQADCPQNTQNTQMDADTEKEIFILRLSA